jgi:hypothetical protein
MIPADHQFEAVKYFAVDMLGESLSCFNLELSEDGFRWDLRHWEDHD